VQLENPLAFRNSFPDGSTPRFGFKSARPTLSRPAIIYVPFNPFPFNPFTRTICVELAPYGITVNNIGPGAIYTPIDADIQAHPEIEKQLMAEIPLSRWGKPEEIAGLAMSSPPTRRHT
jgi:hypothetical protein